ncbi:MAG TPA: DUF3014 domain-containing protein [Steroidobacteraceae bacterium]
MEEDAKKWLWWAIPVVVFVGLATALYYGRKHKEEPVVHQAPPAPMAPAAEAPPPGHVLAPDTANAKPLPTLSDSDAELRESLSGVFGRSLEQLLVPKDVVRHLVVTIDNLPRKKVAIQLRPLQATAGTLAVSGTDEVTLSEDNFARYEPVMKILKNADTKQVVAVYQHFYPLFQQAYVELGYPDGYFNKRLIEVIDHLLATPEIRGPIKLVQPSVFYQFADPTLEERSAGQKLLIRMGDDNAAIIKLKLRELRRELSKREQPQ